MKFVIIAVTAFFTSGLTLFSGFGVGMLLLPAFVLFFPIELAVGLTAIVHFLNNLFKLTLLGKYANRHIVLLFGLPAIPAAFIGANSLLWFSDMRPFLSFTVGSHIFVMTPIKTIIAVLMMLFAFIEMTKKLESFTINKKLLPVGGLLSGFFGGLSGHQGAIRSAFLIKSGLQKESFIGTGVMISCIVDITRIFVYSSRYMIQFTHDNMALLATAVLAAFSGVFFGSRLLKKVTMRVVQVIVAVMLFTIAVGLGFGLI